MKKKIFTLVTLVPLLCSCGFKGEHEMFLSGDLSESLLNEINNNEQLESIMSSTTSYALFYGLKGCSSCEKVKTNLEEYIKQTKQLIYYVDGENPGVNKSKEYNFATSALHLFDNGKQYALLKESSLDNPKMVKNNLSKYYKDAKATVFTNINNFCEYIKLNKGTANIINRTIQNKEHTVVYDKENATIIYFIDAMNDFSSVRQLFNIDSDNYSFQFDNGTII